MQTISDIIQSRNCSTAKARGLSLQIIDQMNLLIPGGVLADIDDLNVAAFDGAVNLFMQPKAKNALRRAIAKRNTTLNLNSCFRTVVQQHILYSWRGTHCVGIAAKPGRSNHEDGLAIDIPEYQAWRSALEAEGWDWFGPGDEVHFTYIGGGVQDDVGDIGVKAFQVLWNKHNPADKISEDGNYGEQTAARLNRSPANGFGTLIPGSNLSVTRILKVADPLMRGDDVRQVQVALVTAKLLKSEQIDSVYGPVTKVAVENFQKKSGLAVDGQVGPATRKILLKSA